MNKIQFPLYRKAEKLIDKYHNNSSERIFLVPFNEVFTGDYRVVSCYCIAIQGIFLMRNIAVKCIPCYNIEKIVVYLEDDQVKQKYSVQIPYSSRTQYLDFVLKVNRLVELDGFVALFVNNNPYSLESYLTIETQNADVSKQIEQLIVQYHLKRVFDKGADELILEMQYRKWNMQILGPTEDSVISAFNQLYLFSEESSLKQLGYDNSANIVRKKVFISYCHNDSGIVYQVKDSMERFGINCWIDTQDINVGEHILHKILSGIKESDLAVLFISSSTLTSDFAQMELQNIMSEMIKKNTGWFLVKLDTVDPDAILPGLSNYLYYNFNENNNIDRLTESIIKKIDGLK